ncbi:unnamed protein product, partial [marine sediment metagenome]
KKKAGLSFGGSYKIVISGRASHFLRARLGWTYYLEPVMMTIPSILKLQK